MSSERILYMTDKYRVSQGYAPAFERLLRKSNINRSQVVLADIYNLVDKPLAKKATESTWKFNPEKLDAITAAFRQRIKAIRPTLVVVSCPAVLGALTGGDLRSSTLEKMRGGVYDFEGTRCIVTYPITAINQRIDARTVVNDDGETDTQEPYRVKDGATILAWDWRKIGRFFNGRENKLPPFRYSICRTLDDCYAARDYLKDCRLVATDIETALYPPTITCVGYTGLHESGAVHSFVIPFYDEFAEGGVFWASPDDHAIAWTVVRDINNNDVPKTLQNGVYDAAYFMRDQLGLRNYWYDSQVLWWCLYMEMPKRLDFISSVLLDNYQYWKDDIKGDEQSKVESGQGSMERYWRYNALDCYNTLFCTLSLLVQLRKNPQMQFNYNDAFMRCMAGFKMSMRGLNKDEERRTYHRESLLAEMNKQTELLRYMLDDPDFNINSSDHKKHLLYDIFGLRPRNDRGRFVERDGKGKGKAPSAGKIPLKMAKTEHPLFDYILSTLESALEPRVQLSNIFGYPDETKPSGVRGGYFIPRGRILTALGGVATETTRLNSKESAFWEGGNLQNVRGKYKDWIIPDENHIFLDVDYSQSDDVFISYESQDPDKIKVIEDDLDAHAVNGELFFGIPYEKIVEGKHKKEDWCVHPIIGVRQNSKRAGHGCVLGGCEVLTRKGWVRIDEFKSGDEAMAVNPFKRTMQWESADQFVTDFDGWMHGFTTQSSALMMTPNHKMWTEELTVCRTHEVVGKRVTIPTAGYYDPIQPKPPLARLQVALMADGSFENGLWRISLKKPRKIERLFELCREAGVIPHEVAAPDGYRRFHIHWKNPRKRWGLDMMELSLANRRALLEEAAYWDGDHHGNSIRFFTAIKWEGEAFEQLALASGFSTKITETTASSNSFNPGGKMSVVSLTRKQTRGIRAERWHRHYHNGKVYCLTIPSGFFVVRQNGLVSITGNSNFQMAAMTLYVTMGREAVVACAKVLGHADADGWDQTRLINLCGVLMGRYRKRYKRLTEREWYKEIADELRRTGKVTNCFGVTRQFLGDANDNGTQREATAFYGQSATAGNMNRVMNEIDWGYIPENFRDGPNPDRYAKPLMMDWASHGFTFLLQVHDNFLPQLNLQHPRWKEAAHNLLQVMNRPVIIHGREVRVKAEAELGIRWGKAMLPWDGDVDKLDSIVAKLKHG